MTKFALSFAAVCSLLIPFSLHADSAKTIIVLDASGSMWGQVEGRPKIEIARETIAGLLETLNPDLQLGLMAYGHRTKGDCSDIELLVAPGTVDRASFIAKVNSLIPRGKTPLTDAVEQAAAILKYEEEKANVILISDGIETCDGDPKALGTKLKEAGVDFKAHIVAFDLTAEESDSFRYLADATGGQFLQAQNSATLKDALEIAVEAVSQPESAMPEPDYSPAMVSCPETVPAGSEFKVTWEGPDNTGDYLTIVKVGAEIGVYKNYAYTRNGNPVTLTAPIEPGAYEVRYMPSGGKQILGSARIEVVAVSATIEAAPTVVAGSYVEVTWDGPDNKGDYLTMVVGGTEAGSYGNYTYTKNGSPLKLRVLSQPGAAEIRYMTGQGGEVLASRPIEITKADVLVVAPEVADAGSEVAIEWVGPGNKGDYVTIVAVGADEGSYKDYQYTQGAKSGVVKVTASETPGEHEVRYMDGQSRKTLATAPLTLLPVSASVSGPESVVAGGEALIEWIGPGFQGYYITIVPKDAEIGEYEQYFYTADRESPTKLKAYEGEGEAEIRYMTAGKQLLASSPIVIVSAEARFTETPAKVAAGEPFRIKWEAADNQGDYISIAKAGSDDAKYESYIYTERGQEQNMTAPEEAGQYELRYLTGGKNSVLARVTIEVIAE